MLSSFFTTTVVVLSIFLPSVNGLTLPFRAPDEATLAAEGINPSSFDLLAASPSGSAPSRVGWTITVDSFEDGQPGTNALDGNNTSIWHSQYSPETVALPHTITIDTLSVQFVNGITYLPRQDGNKNGNIGQHKIFTSVDGNDFVLAASGTWYDDSHEKSAAWETRPARFVRIIAITEAGGRGPWACAAEFYVYTVPTYTPPPTNLGSWSPTIDLPLVPAAAAIEVDTGNVLMWSAWSSLTQYNNPGKGQTLTCTYNPTTQIVSQRLVTNTQHDMFCPGISYDKKGHITVSGGNDAKDTSIFIPTAWSAAAKMNVGRGYHAQVTMGDGRIFTIGGSWSGGVGNKNGEIYDPTKDTWTKLAGCPVKPMLTADAGGGFRTDNHAWLFNWKSSRVFQAGPSKAMNWYNTSGTGGQASAGLRGTDTDAMCGNAVMFDALAGNILTAGGSPDYQDNNSTTNTNLITLGAIDKPATVTPLLPMTYPRIFANGVVLPDGSVFVAGGQTYGLPYNEDTSHLTPELWSPVTRTWKPLLPNGTPRVYHSWGLLMMDATVMVGGGGLCNQCSTNHFDSQIFTPPYLLNADGSAKTRPVISSISARSNKPGATITVKTAAAVKTFSLVRYGTATHTVNTDQRRVPLTSATTGTNTYSVTLGINDYGVMTPGYWMLFAMDASGTPSVATTIYII